MPAGTGWEDFLLAEQPQWAYFSAAPFSTGGGAASGQQGFSPSQEQYWRGQYGDVWSRYLGELGGATRGGDIVGGFTDYLEDMPFTQMYYQNVSPRERGGTARFSPTTRYMY